MSVTGRITLTQAQVERLALEYQFRLPSDWCVWRSVLWRQGQARD